MEKDLRQALERLVSDRPVAGTPSLPAASLGNGLPQGALLP